MGNFPYYERFLTSTYCKIKLTPSFLFHLKVLQYDSVGTFRIPSVNLFSANKSKNLCVGITNCNVLFGQKGIWSFPQTNSEEPKRELENEQQFKTKRGYWTKFQKITYTQSSFLK